jgi:hypothetical protein
MSFLDYINVFKIFTTPPAGQVKAIGAGLGALAAVLVAFGLSAGSPIVDWLTNPPSVVVMIVAYIIGHIVGFLFPSNSTS